jgi:hypothetical protein
MPQPNRGKDPSVRIYGKYYVTGNIVVGNDKVTKDNWDGGVQFEAGSALNADDPRAMVTGDKLKELCNATKADKPFPMAPFTIQSAKDAYEAVLADAGATLPVRDSVDERAVRETRTGEVTYKKGDGIITDVSQVGGYPEYKGETIVYPQNDGIPDSWKTKYGLSLTDPNVATADSNGDGYMNIEKYIYGIDPSKKTDWKDPKNNVNPFSKNN